MSELKPFTDNFFDNVVVNDENRDIKNNRLELLQMFCNTFNNFLNFSKLEGSPVKKFLFNFEDKSVKNLKNKKNILGGKGANLGEMGRLGTLFHLVLLFRPKYVIYFIKIKKDYLEILLKKVETELRIIEKKLKKFWGFKKPFTRIS